MAEVSLFDLIICSLILILGLKGIINGFIKEVFGLIGLVGGIFIASRVAQDVGGFIDKNIYLFENKASLFLIGFIASLALFWTASVAAGFAISKLVKLSGLGFMDKLLGFLIGGMKIFLVVSIIVFTLSNIEIVKQNIEKRVQNSFMYPIFLQFGSFLVKLDTDSITNSVKNKIVKIKNGVNISI